MGRFNKGANTNLYFICSDCIFCGLAFFIATILSGMYFRAITEGYFILFFAFLAVYILACNEARLYNITTFFYVDRFFKRVSCSFLIATAVTSTLLFFNGSEVVDQKFYLYFLVCAYPLVLCSAYLLHYILKKRNKGAKRTIIIGDKNNYERFERFLYKCNMRVNVIGYVSIEGKKDSDGYLGNIEELEQILHDNAVDQIYIMERQYDNAIDVQSYINICVEMGVTACVIMNNYEVAGPAQSFVSSVGTYPVVTYHTVTLNASSRAMKRFLDIVGASVGIILSSPIMLITAILIKLDSKGPVLFKQKRVGLNGRRFDIYKFRSMCDNADEMKKELKDQNEMQGEFMFKIQNDPRITRVGKFIRKTSIDELPQFFNVLKGDMSLVGTRPPTTDEVEQYERNHWRRISIKPGITGLWQVSGRNSITDFSEVVELDTQYIDKWSLMMDIKILFQTFLMVVLRRGAF